MNIISNIAFYFDSGLGLMGLGLIDIIIIGNAISQAG